uniref:Ketosynthase family 3 (KS3) domain-containing protein n=1 Tax=Alexandrium catenella TaxID=2925 RepID=A0A7S1SEG7_ALECA|mmetsp:Transcript_97933/g.260155  ORF Transcript_97933/g.260155 Transcript_97933/m.260155 type:complete len:1260 (+) Transcript_97933:64-3843(+)
MAEGEAVVSADPKRFINVVVQIHGLDGRISPDEGDSGEVDANNMIGRAVDWSEEKGKYLVCTFDALMLSIPEDNLREYTPPLPQEGGFDVAWPYYEETFFEFCANVNNAISAKNWCYVQMTKSQESRDDALVKAKRKDFEVPKPEFINDYLGRKGKGKVSHIAPLDTIDEEDVANMNPASNDLEQYDMDITSLFGVMGPMTWDSMGFHSMGRTEGMVWLPFASSREEAAMTPEPLNDEDIDEENMVEKHIQFLRRRKLCCMYLIDNEGGSLTLNPRSDLKMEPVTLDVRKGMLLVFRSDQMSFTFQPKGSHLTLQAWFMEAPPKITLGDIVANADNLTEALGITSGPLVPQGARAHIMAGSCLTGGGVWNLEEASCMYLSGTDAHTYVPSTRFDTDLYFTKQGDTDLIPFQNSYHHHGGLCYDAEVMSFDNSFFGYTEHEASLMQPAHHKSLEVGYETLWRAGWTKKSLNNSPVLVYVGDCGTEWWNQLLVRQMQGEHFDPHGRLGFEAGKSLAITSQRISYNLGLRGPAWSCDTACSSGLTAFCTAMFSIKKPTERGTESPSMDPHCCGALAGGTNMIVDAGVYIGGSGQHMLSLKGRCFTFDMSGDGYARGEGTSMVYVMMSDNDRDTEMQEAMAIGNKVNQDGRSASMTAPNGPSQQMCIKASLREAGVMPHDITASECHGTGTSLGDPIEVGSLRGVQETDDRDGPLLCTSSKSNIGHLEANAGTTGLFKCMLMSKYGAGLPNCHLRSLNPHLDIAGWPTCMISECADYNQQSGLVGVSSFGVSGTNSHAEIWSYCRHGPNMAGRKRINMDKIKQITLTCPVTLGPIDYLTGEPAREDGMKYTADCLRDELMPYDISTLAYEGAFRYRREALDDDDIPVNPDGVKVTIHGSWSGFLAPEEMTEEEDGSYTFFMVLGDTRCESFYVCLGGIPDYSFYPSCNRGSSRIFIEGPDNKRAGKRWYIDGRDEEVPAGTVYKISFFWGQARRKISWEEVEPESRPKVVRSEHRYQITGSWTSGRKDELAKSDGVWEYRSKIGVSGREEFMLMRDCDDPQMIYPAEGNCTKTTVAVRGPDHLGAGKMWVVTGPVGELVKVRLEVDDAKIIVAIVSKSMGEKVWESTEGWDRHSYWLNFQGGPCTKMTMDPEVPGVFRARAQIGSNFSEEYRGLCEFFNVIIDEDPTVGFCPDVSCASTGECIVWGPELGCSDRPFLAKSLQVGAGFEVILDLKAVDRRKTVTWVWDTPPSFQFAEGMAVMDA